MRSYLAAEAQIPIQCLCYSRGKGALIWSMPSVKSHTDLMKIRCVVSSAVVASEWAIRKFCGVQREVNTTGAIVYVLSEAQINQALKFNGYLLVLQFSILLHTQFPTLLQNCGRRDLLKIKNSILVPQFSL